MGRQKTQSGDCPCGSGKNYEACCGPLHQGIAAPTPEALMRSRYAAYVLGLEGYLLETWHPDTRPGPLGLAEDAVRWLGLEVVRAPVPEGEAGEVEFVARYKVGGRAHRLRERSRFRRQEGRWYYVDGIFPEA